MSSFELNSERRRKHQYKVTPAACNYGQQRGQAKIINNWTIIRTEGQEVIVSPTMMSKQRA